VRFGRVKHQSSMAFLLIQALRHTILDVHYDVLTHEWAFSKGTKIFMKSENVDWHQLPCLTATTLFLSLHRAFRRDI